MNTHKREDANLGHVGWPDRETTVWDMFPVAALETDGYGNLIARHPASGRKLIVAMNEGLTLADALRTLADAVETDEDWWSGQDA